MLVEGGREEECSTLYVDGRPDNSPGQPDPWNLICNHRSDINSYLLVPVEMTKPFNTIFSR